MSAKHLASIPVPVLTPRLSSYWLRLVTSVPTSVARALIDGLSQDVIAEDDRLAALIPQDLLSFEAAAREALDAAVSTRFRRTGWKALTPVRTSGPSTASMRSRRMASPKRGRPLRASGRFCAASATTATSSMAITCGGCDGRSTGWSAARASVAGGGIRRNCASGTWLMRGGTSRSQPEERLTLLMEMKGPRYEHPGIRDPRQRGCAARSHAGALAPRGRMGAPVLVRAAAGARIPVERDRARNCAPRRRISH